MDVLQTGVNLSINPDSMTTIDLLESKFNFDIIDIWIKAINICIGLLGISGNSLIILVMMTSRRLRSNHTNIIILNQSVMDFGAGMFLILQSMIENNERRFTSLADNLYCRLWLTKLPLFAALVSSTYSLVALTIDRYLAVVHPIWHRNYFRRWQVQASVITTSWFLGIIPLLLYDALSSGIEDGKCLLFYYWSSAKSAKIWGVALSIYQFMLPMGIHIYCYVRIARVILKTTSSIAQPTTNNDATPSSTVTVANDYKTRSGRNVIKTLAAVTLCFFFCWFPSQTAWIILQIDYTLIDTTGTFFNITIFLMLCNCCVNPFIYVTKYTQFQKAMRVLFCPTRVEPGSNSNTST